jgi:hypothetical protein
LLTQPGLPATAALCRQAVVLEQEAPREDAQAAWLTPAERWLLHALRLDGTEAEQAPWARLAALADGVSDAFPADQALCLLTPAHLRLGATACRSPILPRSISRRMKPSRSSPPSSRCLPVRDGRCAK